MPITKFARSSGFAATLLAVPLFALAMPAQAQNQTEGYKFREAVRSGDKPQEVEELLAKPGTVVINSKSPINGETALHIATSKGSADYVGYLLARGADANVRDNSGATPLLIAATMGRSDIVEKLLTKAAVDYPNSAGETALIRAVQRRDLDMMRILLAAGANPDKTDTQAGFSARDYARENARMPALLKMIEDTPKKAARQVAGPKF